VELGEFDCVSSCFLPCVLSSLLLLLGYLYIQPGHQVTWTAGLCSMGFMPVHVHRRIMFVVR